MKVWITKYALTRGILYAWDATITGDESVVRVPSLGYNDQPAFFFGECVDWHRSQESAVAKAEDMRTKKIHSLKKQIARLEKLDFSKDKESK